MPSTCALSAHRTLISNLIRVFNSPDCAAPVRLDIAESTVALVMTFSSGSNAEQRGPSRTIGNLQAIMEHTSFGRVRAVLVGKGSMCDANTIPLGDWLRAGRAHCIEGPNVGARESHTIWQFLADFYAHLPRVALFVQDDPQVHAIGRLQSIPNWIGQLEASVSRRASESPTVAASSSWVPQPCACMPVNERFGVGSYGGFSPLHWWMRSFLAPYANGSVSLPSRLQWPSMAQFALSRTMARRYVHRARSIRCVALGETLTLSHASVQALSGLHRGERAPHRSPSAAPCQRAALATLE